LSWSNGVAPSAEFNESQLVAVTLPKVHIFQRLTTRLNGFVMNACSRFKNLHDSQTFVADGGKFKTSKHSSSYMYHIT
jgi:hypothetical protein